MSVAFEQSLIFFMGLPPFLFKKAQSCFGSRQIFTYVPAGGILADFRY